MIYVLEQKTKKNDVHLFEPQFCYIWGSRGLNYTGGSHHGNKSVKCTPPYTPLLYSNTWVNRGIHCCLSFALKHRLWVLIRTPQLGGSNVYLQSMFWAKWKKNNRKLSFLQPLKFTIYCIAMLSYCVSNKGYNVGWL